VRAGGRPPGALAIRARGAAAREPLLQHVRDTADHDHGQQQPAQEIETHRFACPIRRAGVYTARAQRARSARVVLVQSARDPARKKKPRRTRWAVAFSTGGGRLVSVDAEARSDGARRRSRRARDGSGERNPMTWKWCLLPGIAVAALGMPPATDAEPPVAAKVRVEPDAIDALRRDRDALIAVAETEAALEPAREIVARLETGDADPSEDLLKLGLIHASLGDHAAAESAYLRAIEARERRHGIFAAALIPAYHALGRAYLDAGRLDDALAALEHARTLSH